MNCEGSEVTAREPAEKVSVDPVRIQRRRNNWTGGAKAELCSRHFSSDQFDDAHDITPVPTTPDDTHDSTPVPTTPNDTHDSTPVPTTPDDTHDSTPVPTTPDDTHDITPVPTTPDDAHDSTPDNTTPHHNDQTTQDDTHDLADQTMQDDTRDVTTDQTTHDDKHDIFTDQGTHDDTCDTMTDDPVRNMTHQTDSATKKTTRGRVRRCLRRMGSEKTEDITEAHQVFKEWNADWHPSHFMVKFCEAEIGALEAEFPESAIIRRLQPPIRTDKIRSPLHVAEDSTAWDRQMCHPSCWRFRGIWQRTVKPWAPNMPGWSTVLLPSPAPGYSATTVTSGYTYSTLNTQRNPVDHTFAPYVGSVSGNASVPVTFYM
ncbi:hypothetical protein Bbelb_378570 [Branchiostoma belcheri]|nr:hypothetical protein Bbelb_378570 [Branchiostoma belcheri]